jgi:hypothetical protein
MVVLSALMLLLTVNPTAAETRKVALGMSLWEASYQPSAMDSFSASIGGNSPAIWTLWSQWGDRGGARKCEPGKGTCNFPTAMAAEVRARGAVPMIWWEPMSTREAGCTYSRHADIAAGKHDRYIKAWAQAAKQFGTPIILRFAHEINGKYFPWSVTNCGNSLTSYKAGWRHIYKTFRQVGATNVKFLWTVAKQSCKVRGCNPYKAFYPGNRYVNYVGFSSFNWGDNKKWTSMVFGVSRIMSFFQRFTSKPVIVAELASNSRGGPASFATDKPNWIREGYPAVYERFPSIKAIVYLNADLTHVGHPDWSLNTPKPGALKAYEDVAGDPRFQGKIGS